MADRSMLCKACAGDLLLGAEHVDAAVSEGDELRGGEGGDVSSGKHKIKLDRASPKCKKIFSAMFAH